MASGAMPTIVLLPGAFAAPSIFDTFVTHLHAAGFETAIASYPSATNENPQSASCNKDAAHIREKILLPLIKQGREVLLFAHSYGGVVAGIAAAGLSRTTRQVSSTDGGIIGLFYVAATLLPEGKSLQDLTGGTLPPTIKQDTPENGMCTTHDSAIPHATAAFTTPAGQPGWIEDGFKGRRVYVRTMEDANFPPKVQRAQIEQSGVKWKLMDIMAGHEAFAAKPGEVCEMVREALGEWEKV